MPGRYGRIVSVTVAGQGLSRRRQAGFRLLAVALLALLGSGSTYAGAAPILTGQLAPRAVPTTASAPHTPDILPDECHPTTHTAWDGSSYTTVELTAVGDRVTSPGDHVTCTFAVPNNGPSSATLSVALRAEQPSTGSANPDLTRDVHLVWDVAGKRGTVRFDQAIMLGEHVVAEVQMSQGAVAPVLVGFTMPVETKAHTRGGRDSTVLSFDVMVMLHGDPSTSAPPRPDSPVATVGPWPLTLLGSTGAEVAVVAGVALVLVLGGTAVWAVARRSQRRLRESAGSSVGDRLGTAPRGG